MKRQSQTVAEFQKKVVCTKNPAAWKQKEAISKRKGKQKSAMSTKVHKAEKVERCKETEIPKCEKCVKYHDNWIWNENGSKKQIRKKEVGPLDKAF